jgi:alpha-galactosidase
MIPLGHVSVSGRSVGPDRQTGLTKDEQMTMISLWALAPSPMMLGMNLPDNDPWTLALITNDEILAVNQDSLGKQAIRQPRAGMSAVSEVWVRDMADGSKVIGLFNRIGVQMPIRVEWRDIGVKSTKSVRDLWLRKDLPHLGAGYEATIGPHGAVLLRVVPGE